MSRTAFARAVLASALIAAPAVHASSNDEPEQLADEFRHLEHGYTAGTQAPDARVQATEVSGAGHSGRSTDESLLIEMMSAQMRALDAYTACLEGRSDVAPCAPPRPLQLPPLQDAPDGHDAQGASAIDAASHRLKDAEIRALRAHAKCVRTTPSAACGPPP